MTKTTLLRLVMTVTSFCILATTAAAQDEADTDYKSLISEASTLYYEGQYTESAERYAAAFELNETPGYGDLYDAACATALAGQTDGAFQYLRRSIDGGWEKSAHMNSDSDLATLREKTDRWSELETAVTEAMRSRYGESFNEELAAELAEIYQDDQRIRTEWGTLKEKYGNPLPDSVNQDYMQRWHQTDSVCLVRVEKIITEHGWPKRSMVGRTGAASTFLVIQHAPLETQERYFPMLEAAVAEGEARAADLALMTDRILMQKDLPQRYGSQVRSNPETGENEFFSIEDPANVNARRDSVGLRPIEEYAKRFGIEWEVTEGDQ